MEKYEGLLGNVDVNALIKNWPQPNANTFNVGNSKDYQLPQIDRVSPDEVRAYQEKSIHLLQQITDNTSSIADLIELVSISNEKQDEVISIIGEILEIAKSKNKEEAGTKFTKVMKKLSDTVKNAETIGKLSSFAILTYNTVISNLDTITEVVGKVSESIEKIVK